MPKTEGASAKPRRSRGPQRSVESHAAILDAAEELLAEGGVAALSFEAIARRARAGKPTLYRWWPNKAALLLELYDRQKGREIQAPDLGALQDDLVGYTRALWRFWRETPAGPAFAALIAEAQNSDDTRAALAQHFYDRLDGPSAPIFERAAARGELQTGVDPVVLRRAYVATNWFHLLCGRLEDEAVGPQIAMLLAGAHN